MGLYTIGETEERTHLKNQFLVGRFGWCYYGVVQGAYTVVVSDTDSEMQGALFKREGD